MDKQVRATLLQVSTAGTVTTERRVRRGRKVNQAFTAHPGSQYRDPLDHLATRDRTVYRARKARVVLMDHLARLGIPRTVLLVHRGATERRETKVNKVNPVTMEFLDFPGRKVRVMFAVSRVHL